MGAIYLNDIRYGGVSGFPEKDQVYVDPKLNSGTKIAEITVNDETKSLYTNTIVPNPSGSPQDELVTLNINNRVYKLAGGEVEDVYVNGISVLDQNDIAQINSYEEITQAEYDALPSSKLTNNVLYAIKDSGGSGGGDASALSELDDVNLTNLTDKQFLQYNSNLEQWVNIDEPVIANPLEMPTNELNTIKIGSIIYNITGGGPDSGRSILAWKNITPSEYEALSQEEKNNGVIYLVSDSAQGEMGFMSKWKSTTSLPNTSDDILYFKSNNANGSMGIQMIETNIPPINNSNNIPYLVKGV